MIGFDLNDGFRYKKYLFNLLKKKEPDKIISGDRFWLDLHSYFNLYFYFINICRLSKDKIT